jgi:hypothetical protein
MGREHLMLRPISAQICPDLGVPGPTLEEFLLNLRELRSFLAQHRGHRSCSIPSLNEVVPMTRYLRTGLFLASLVFLAKTTAFAQTSGEDLYREWVDYRDGEISVDFDQTPVQFALYAIHAKTGFQIVMPAMSEAKAVSFRVSRQALEPAMRSLISSRSQPSRARPPRLRKTNLQPNRYPRTNERSCRKNWSAGMN